ncbi:MAG: Dam family site-specific DNA-(adenine-N6)-methyltransferase, partial [Candidatus Helarchaeota archaeon]|nr:Dam family site-specific DNA-(adenine-N6)-methyltransferase [Candidatus Helarchaeota archaeon]
MFGVPYPFLKWAGGKRQLLNKLDKYFPNHFEKYIEPFMGGGAVFFYLLPERTILIDNNEELINSFKVIQKQLEELILSLKKHRNEKEYFYKIRNVDRNLEEFSKWSNVERASRTIYLNRCCFNGLYRVNSKGHFNVPFGKYKNPKFCDEKNLRAVNLVSKNVKLLNASFEKCLDFAEKGDFIYLDPPYHPLSETANFT